MILQEIGNLGGLIAFFIAIMLVPPILLIVLGFAIRKKYSTASKVIFILAGLYLVIGLGICGALLS